jgi:hypothetical protein
MSVWQAVMGDLAGGAPATSSTARLLETPVAAADSSSSSSCAVASLFANAFISALAAGDAKWAADPGASCLLHEGAQMLGLDKQLYVGKVAIIHRLNAGMQQLLTTVQAYLADATVADSDGNSSSDRPDLSASNYNSHDNSCDNGGSSGNNNNNISLASSTAMLPPQLHSTARTGTAATASILADQVRQATQLSVTCPAPVSKPSVVVATYTFKLGLRRFSLRDEFIIKSGQIVRMRRSRN